MPEKHQILIEVTIPDSVQTKITADNIYDYILESIENIHEMSEVGSPLGQLTDDNVGVFALEPHEFVDTSNPKEVEEIS